MSVKEIQRELASLPPEQRDEVTAFLFHLRHKEDENYHSEIAKRLEDKTAENWLSPEDFEKRLTQ
ncbi:MAG: hypothetical protein AB8F34_09265 [Akkermansiaceae bacterium]